MIDPISSAIATKPPSPAREAANKLEASFLSEMLKHCGVGEGEFGSFLRDAQANEMVKSGGIGLSEAFFEAMKETKND